MSTWPAVKAYVVASLPLLSGWAQVAVYNGQPVTSESPGDFVTVGFVPGEDFAGSFEPTEELGDLRGETGTLRSELVSWNGDSDLPAAEARAFALFDAWESAVRADHTLGGLVSDASLTVDVQPSQSTNATLRLVVTLSYLARS